MYQEGAKKMVVVNVVISPDLKRAIKRVADQERRTMSQWVRLLIEKELSQTERSEIDE